MKKSLPRALAGAILLVLIPLSLMALPPGNEAALGPLEGRNVYAPHLPWFSFPAHSAAALPRGSIRAGSALYYINEFSTYPFNTAEAPLSESRQHELRAMDYESTIWELGLSWQALPDWRFSADWRLHFRYGGFLDSFIQSWHDILHVGNAGREYFRENQSDWNIKGHNIPAYTGQGFHTASGDLDILALWSFYTAPSLSLAASGALKIPTGNTSGGFSSGYPDLGLALLLDWRPWKRWIFYLNTALIVPLAPCGMPMFQCVPALEFRAAKGLSILLQLHLQTSPIRGGQYFHHGILGPARMFGLPQTNVKLGLKGQSGRFTWQLYFEEDPITWEGADIVVYFKAGWLIR